LALKSPRGELSAASLRRSAAPSTRASGASALLMIRQRSGIGGAEPSLLCRAAPSRLRRVANGLDIVALGVDDEGGEIVGVIVLADAGRAVVLAAGGERRGMKAADRAAALGRERYVD